MSARTSIRSAAPATTAFCTLALAAVLVAIPAPAFAGGQMMSFDDPGTAKDARFQKAALLVTALNCGSAANATIRGVAEGVVDGKRRSMPLKLVATGKAGQVAVFQQWPSSGSWALTFELHGLYALVDLSRTLPASARPAERGLSAAAHATPSKPSPYGEVLLFWDRIPESALSEALAAM